MPTREKLIAKDLKTVFDRSTNTEEFRINFENWLKARFLIADVTHDYRTA